MIRRWSVVMIVLCCGPAQAAEVLSSSYWEAAYLSSAFERQAGSVTLDDDVEGFRAGASIGLLPYLNFVGDYSQRRYENERDGFYSAGLAGHTLDPTYQFFGAVTYERYDFDDNLSSELDATNEGYGVQLGARAALAHMAVHASYKYLDLGKVDDTTELTGAHYGGGVVFDLTSYWSLTADYSVRTHEYEDSSPGAAGTEDEYSEWTVGFRRYFVTQTDQRKRTGGLLADLFGDSAGE